jgi:hypothetical protein
MKTLDGGDQVTGGCREGGERHSRFMRIKVLTDVTVGGPGTPRFQGSGPNDTEAKGCGMPRLDLGAVSATWLAAVRRLDR